MQFKSKFFQKKSGKKSKILGFLKKNEKKKKMQKFLKKKRFKKFPKISKIFQKIFRKFQFWSKCSFLHVKMQLFGHFFLYIKNGKILHFYKKNVKILSTYM